MASTCPRGPRHQDYKAMNVHITSNTICVQKKNEQFFFDHVKHKATTKFDFFKLEAQCCARGLQTCIDEINRNDRLKISKNPSGGWAPSHVQEKDNDLVTMVQINNFSLTSNIYKLHGSSST
jgi:hypothetical protein